MGFFNMFNSRSDKSGGGRHNFIELRNDALQSIVRKLTNMGLYGSSDPDYTRLELWAVHDADDPTHIKFTDDRFATDLRRRLEEDGIEVVKIVKINDVASSLLADCLDRYPKTFAVIEGRLYGRFPAKDGYGALNTSGTHTASIECASGADSIISPMPFRFNPADKTEWHIGRSLHPTPTFTNDIALADSCGAVSRKLATIYVRDDNYYISVNQGASKVMLTGHSENKPHAINSLSPERLSDGDIITLSPDISIRFIYR